MVIISRWYQNKSRKQRIYHYVRYFLLWSIAVLIFNLLYSFNANTPKIRSMIAENELLVKQIEDINFNIGLLNDQLSVLNRRDNGTYRMVFGLDKHTFDNYPVEDLVLDVDLFNDRYSGFIKDTWEAIYRAKLDIFNRSVAFDTIAEIADQHISLTRFIPAIWPIDVKNFKWKIDYYGWRLHPVLKVRKFHSGLDLSCDRNTTVIAPADGVVKYVRNGWNGGYGNEVVINHGMGYQTRFAHLNKSLVKVGDPVKRGDKIALTGSTGRSTGAHLHYEVIYKNKTVNPLNYFRQDQSKEDITHMLENAREQSFEDDRSNIKLPEEQKIKKKKNRNK